MSLATVDEEGQPWLRTVLLKLYDARGFVFFTNYESREPWRLWRLCLGGLRSDPDPARWGGIDDLRRLVQTLTLRGVRGPNHGGGSRPGSRRQRWPARSGSASKPSTKT